MDDNDYDYAEEEGIAPGQDGKVHCLKCLMTFGHMSSAKRHYRNRHMMSSTVACKFCKRVLKNVDSLNEHVRYVHGISQKMLKTRIVPK